jgi:DNA-binding transcriptional ArsR family regulator
MSAVFSALADPARRAILAQLTKGDANVNDLAAPFDMSQPENAIHLKVLDAAKLISRTREGTARLSHLEGEPLKDATTWLVTCRKFLEESYERLDKLLQAIQQHEEGTSNDQD